MKSCIICLEEKELNQYYRHARMSDGHLNKCKDCCKKQAKERHRKLSLDNDWREKEKKRGREKYFRLGYKDANKPSKEARYKSSLKYRAKYPEKQRASIISQHLKGNGKHKHHWNYSAGFELDIIHLTVLQHRAIHRHTIYDQEQMMYRDLNGVLLDSRELCEKYYQDVLKSEGLF